VNSDVYPYFVPPSSALLPIRWQIAAGDAWIDLPEWIEGWDADTNLVMRTIVEIDLTVLRAEAELEANAALTLNVSWSSSTSRMTGTVFTSELAAAVTDVHVELPAERIGGMISLLTTVSLRTDNPSASPGIARFAGSVFLRQETRVALEGDGAMFPVAVVDFAATPFDANSSWKLEATDDLSAPFLGAFQLLVNTRDEELVKAITSNATEGRNDLLVDELEARVAALLVELAFDARDELDLNSSWAQDSVGEVLAHFLSEARRLGLADGLLQDGNSAEFRSKLDGVVRSLGMGRAFE
jgi:hypothetical protein